MSKAEKVDREVIDFIEDLASNGLRCDLNPTRDPQSQGDAELWYPQYLKGVDAMLRSRAKWVLEEMKKRRDRKEDNDE